MSSLGSLSRSVHLPLAAQAPKLPVRGDIARTIGTVDQAGSANKAGEKDEISKVAESFEAIILRQLLASMRKAKLSEDVFGSSATENFREMADARTAESMAKMGQFGIAAMVERQLRGLNSAQAVPNIAVEQGATK